MNLIDFEVTKVLGSPREHKYIDKAMWIVPVEYSDDAGDGLIGEVYCFSVNQVLEVKPGYIGQH